MFKLRRTLKDSKESVDNVKRKRKRITSKSNFDTLKADMAHVKECFDQLRLKHDLSSIFNEYSGVYENNKEALNKADECYEAIDAFSLTNASGYNAHEPILKDINNITYIFPKDCKFYCKDVADIGNVLGDEQFDIILLDPPWWNKYIRRKNSKSTKGYRMMENVHLSEIPIGKLLTNDGFVVIWCTNAPLHANDLQNRILPAWGLHTAAKWYWLKVTQSGEPICEFAEPPAKQPFEQIIIAKRESSTKTVPDGKLVISTPSALHSHKPPFSDVLNAVCGGDKRSRRLEIFARYLMPGWSSWGLEAVKLQHMALYENVLT